MQTPPSPRIRSLLLDFRVQIPPSSLTMVVWSVSVGKSTLVKAMLGNVSCQSGNVHVHSRVTYMAQHAAIFIAMLRKNILFGNGFDKKKYALVVVANTVVHPKDMALQVRAVEYKHEA